MQALSTCHNFPLVVSLKKTKALQAVARVPQTTLLLRPWGIGSMESEIEQLYSARSETWQKLGLPSVNGLGLGTPRCLIL